MNIEEKLNNYVAAYQKILNESMSDNTPYDKLIKKLDELFEQFKITDEKARDARLATLSNLVQGVTATSQQIALQFITELERIELEKSNSAAEIELKTRQVADQEKQTAAEINLRNKQIEEITQKIASDKEHLALEKSNSAAEIELKTRQVADQEKQTAAEIDLKKQQLTQITAQTQLIAAQKALAEAEIPLKQKELQLAEKRLLLAEKEAEFNAKRAELIEKQAQSEIARKAAIERETRSFDDRLRIQEATLLKDSVFGYTAGGLTPPADMITKMYNSIDAVTP